MNGIPLNMGVEEFKQFAQNLRENFEEKRKDCLIRCEDLTKAEMNNLKMHFSNYKILEENIPVDTGGVRHNLYIAINASA
ncbi:hypothetical protein J4225_00855 [Candidatus Pacearchaeota archaeon]|nr:hypothetical protein [Candidatus Pacearchaeota archaeon]